RRNQLYKAFEECGTGTTAQRAAGLDFRASVLCYPVAGWSAHSLRRYSESWRDRFCDLACADKRNYRSFQFAWRSERESAVAQAVLVATTYAGEPIRRDPEA